MFSTFTLYNTYFHINAFTSKWNDGGDIYVLGNHISSSADVEQKVKKQIEKIIWFSYRKNFLPLSHCKG